jgi:uncharacterized protein YndB with AHSA1/START domain
MGQRQTEVMSDETTQRADVEQVMKAGATAICQAWTQGFDTWFATPGTLVMGGIGQPFYFDVAFEGQHHPHYGRLLAVDPDRMVELAWLTGRGGTDGAETRVRVELSPTPDGTHLTLAHTGFYTEAAARAAQDSWPHVLAHLDEALTGSAPA